MAGLTRAAVAPLLALSAAPLSSSWFAEGAVLANMNAGPDYLIANDLQGSPVKFNTSYAARPNVESFTVYAGPISTRYGEVFWEGVPAVDLPADLVKRFFNKTMAIVGYEQDQVGHGWLAAGWFDNLVGGAVACFVDPCRNSRFAAPAVVFLRVY
jgi:hypothetical protein